MVWRISDLAGQIGGGVKQYSVARSPPREGSYFFLDKKVAKNQDRTILLPALSVLNAFGLRPQKLNRNSPLRWPGVLSAPARQ
ncbi:hypothetical protein BEL04_17420 [Mucilaginibacter sp. PPCGB 2223]|nr:hypothetical protein BEL04_17420 [Mucilaginibacter sp. PPCGB 2223]